MTRCPVEDNAEVDDLAELGTIRRDWQLTGYLGGIAVEVLACSLDTKSGDHPT